MSHCGARSGQCGQDILGGGRVGPHLQEAVHHLQEAVRPLTGGCAPIYRRPRAHLQEVVRHLQEAVHHL